MEIIGKNSSVPTVPEKQQTVNPSLQSDAEGRRQDQQLAQINARQQAQETLQQNRLKRRQLAEQQAKEQAERRLQGRLVTDARRENVQRLDDIAHSRAMQNKVEQTYAENRQARAEQQQRRETVQHQQDIQSNRNAAINLVV